MRYGSVCSGVEATSVAWEPLGFEPVFFSEIEPFPSAVLAHHWPDVPNLGDMTEFMSWPFKKIDILVGGTPCQSFSIAGLRKGLTDDRGNLSLTYMRMVDQLRPRWTVWENVPGVLSANGGRDFGSILGAMAQLGYSFAWRVLDAQNFGVPQRRRRVFLVGCSSGDWRHPASVLFEQSCGSRDFEKGRKEKQDIAPGTVKCFAGNNQSKLAATLQATMHDYSRADGFNTIVYENHGTDSRVKELGEACQTVTARWGTGGNNTPIVYESHPNSSVRRLTPVEAERLQGFPDGHTDIGWNGKPTPDSHRYKAIGNSMAVPVMRWIGQRIKEHDQ